MDENDDLPGEFDVIVVGTGMVESIVAASVSRIGKSVLHLDRNMYYGDAWATLSLDGLIEFAGHQGSAKQVSDSSGRPTISELKDVDEGARIYYLSGGFTAYNSAYKWFIPSEIPESSEDTVKVSIELQSQTDKSYCGEDSGDAKDAIEEDGAASRGDGMTSSATTDREDDLATSKSTEPALDTSSPKQWSQKELLSVSRKFNIDLAPKVIYAKGATVELLLHSCVHRYTEFQSVSKILAFLPDSNSLDEVPCTKSQVFSCRTFSIVDKRILMKVLNTCINFDSDNCENFKEIKDKAFVEVMKSRNTPDHLIKYILESVAAGTDATSMGEACLKIKSFFNNVGRYGHSPFLWPLYGSGELLQAFCRLSAVYGGVYYLGRGAEAVVSNKDNICTGIVSNGKIIKARHVVISSYCCPPDLKSTSKPDPSRINRTILFTDRPLRRGKVDGKEAICILHVSSEDGQSKIPVQVLELPSITGSCPKELYVVQITCEQKSAGWEPVKEVIERLFYVDTSNSELNPTSETLIDNLRDCHIGDWFTLVHQAAATPQVENVDGDYKPEVKPKILFACRYDIVNSDCIKFSESKPANLHLCHGPDFSVDLDRAINQAKEMFGQMYAEEQFLEPTPDPNEITLSDLLVEDNSSAERQQQKTEDADEQVETKDESNVASDSSRDDCVSLPVSH